MHKTLIGILLLAAVLVGQSTGLIPVWTGNPHYEWWTVQRLATALTPLMPAAKPTRYRQDSFPLTSDYKISGAARWAEKSDIRIKINGLDQGQDFTTTNTSGVLTVTLPPSITSAFTSPTNVRVDIEYPIE